MLSVLMATLLIATDPHIFAPQLHDDGEAYMRYAETAAGRDLLNSTELWEAFLEHAIAEKPEAVLITGDLTNHGERASHLLVAAGLERLRQKGIRVFVVPGNHDIDNPWARGFRGSRQIATDSVSPEEFSRIYARYGYADAIDRDNDSLSYLSELDKGRWILMLDSASYASNALLGYPDTGGIFSEQSLEWISRCGQRAKTAGVRMIAAMHHSVADHSSVIVDGFTVDNAETVARTLSQAGVKVVLTGHIHIQDISARLTSAGTLYDVATNALSVFPNLYGRLAWSASTGALEYQTAKVAIPGSSLDNHAREAFGFGVNRLFPEYGKSLVATLNENYFAGREDLNRPIAEMPLFKELAAEEGFFGRYVKSLAVDFDSLADNQLVLR